MIPTIHGRVRSRTCLLLGIAASLALPTTALADYGPKRGVYGGKATSPADTSTHRVHPVSATLTKNGKEIKLLRITAPAPCDSGGSANTSPAWEEVELSRKGRFSEDDKQSIRGDDDTVTTWESTLKGKLGARGGSGKARDVATVRDQDGNVVRTCDSGVVRFELERSERVYGGGVKIARAIRPLFGGVYPVSLERNRRGTKLTSFRIRYVAACGSAGNHTNSFEHSGIDLDRDGEFSLSRKFSYRNVTKTTKYSGKFTLRGQVGENRGSGTYRAKFRARLSSGEKIPCDTGKRKWSVSQR